MIYLVTIALYLFAHGEAVVWRGCEAVGGELLILTLPFWWRSVKQTVVDWILR